MFFEIFYFNGYVFQKRDFTIDQQIALHFLHYSEYQNLFTFYVTQINNPFLNSRISANDDEGLGF